MLGKYNCRVDRDEKIVFDGLLTPAGLAGFDGLLTPAGLAGYDGLLTPSGDLSELLMASTLKSCRISSSCSLLTKPWRPTTEGTMDSTTEPAASGGGPDQAGDVDSCNVIRFTGESKGMFITSEGSTLTDVLLKFRLG